MSAPGSQRGHATRLLYGTLGLTPDQNLIVFPGIAWSGASGYEWRPPRGVNAVRCVMVSGGGGGGSGRLDATSTAKGGGAGGGGGGSCDLTVVLHEDYRVAGSYRPWILQPGLGGAGGASVTGAAANGNPGTAGTDTNLYNVFPPQNFNPNASYFQTTGGGGGAGGTATTATAGTAGAGAIVGQAGAAGVTAGGAGVNPTNLTVIGACGGGSGGGVTSGNAENVGGDGGRWNPANTSINSATIPGGSTTRRAGGNGYLMHWVGSGGAGGVGSNSTTIAGEGGNGICGSGGGGGGAGLSVTGASGAGGRGGDGYILLFLIW